ncbi:MAG: DUF5686 and carboxypeptidase regulatory-like domain-containing protein [Tannerella sp.]|jgi:hypothetical protein|nr:DUF5686 and carboxypeptidase regulatory-like domain-containing protein [Tannerella sp.]
MTTRLTWLFLITCCVITADASAQTLNGRITNGKGQPVPNAALYIRELAHGVMADDSGAVRIALKEGSYTFDISSLGYEKKTVYVTVDNPAATLTVVLNEKAYSLQEITVSAGREDPAYAIMRRAIGMAPFYLHQVKSYESEAYLKGTVKIEKIPALLKITANKENLNEMINKLLVVESHNEVKFTAPDRYEQRVLAVSSSIPSEADFGSGMSITTSNIYSPTFDGDFISPLAPDAFTFYRFSFEGRSLEGGHWINKIRIAPKKKNFKLFSGWIYIVDDSWNVQFLDITISQSGLTFRYKINYNEVKPSVFLPTAFEAGMTANVMGIKASGKYSTSIQYNKLEVNDFDPAMLTKAETSPPAPDGKARPPKQQKTQAKLDKLLAKDELTNRDAYKMAKLMHEISEPEESARRRDTLEILSARRVNVTVDSLARMRDSLYWAGARVLPLLEEEIKSYRESDSLKKTKDSIDSGANEITASISLPHASKWINRTLFGSRINPDEGWRLSYRGLLGLVPEYNFTDGFRIGEKLTLEWRPDEAKSFTLAPSAYYLTARRTVNWQVDATFRYAPLKIGQMDFSAGNTTADFNRIDGNLRLVNSLASLFFAENPIRFYQRKYVSAMNRIDAANGLRLETGIACEERTALENNTSYSFFGKKPSPNIPAGQTAPMPAHTAVRATVRLQYTPRHYYRIRNGRKYYEYSHYPTFMLGYEKGIPPDNGTAVSYDRLEAGIRQQIRINAFDRFNYFVNAGTFLSSDRIYFPDFKHFDTNELWITASSPDNSFALLDNYVFSTSERWLQAHAAYSSMYLLLKNLPFLQNYLFDESLHARLLWTPANDYIEAGYSAGLGDVGRIGIFVGFDSWKYRGVGITVSLPLLNAVTNN